MAMQINQPWRYQLTANVHDTLRSIWCDAGLNGFDQTVANTDVSHARKSLAGVQHVGIANQQIKFIGRPHGCKCCAGHSTHCRK